MKHSKQCIGCTTVFFTPPTSGKLYCSLECRKTHKYTILTCKVCSKEFNRRNCNNVSKSIFCSKKCYQEAHKKKIKICIGCSESFINTWGVASQKYCTHKCYILSQRTDTFTPNYNKSSIDVINTYAREHGYNFQHAENGGEVYLQKLGYWLDGYDMERNTVLEYMEKHHKRKRIYDERRKQEIIELLNCTFIEIWE